MTDESEARDQRIPIMMTRAEVEEIDNWMFERRYRTRARAIRALIDIALAIGRKEDEEYEAIPEYVRHLAILEHKILHGKEPMGRERLYAIVKERAPEIAKDLKGNEARIIGKVPK